MVSGVAKGGGLSVQIPPLALKKNIIIMYMDL